MRYRVLILGITLLLSGCEALQLPFAQSGSSNPHNKVIVRGYINEIINQGNWNSWETHFPKRVTFNGRRFDRDQFRNLVAAFRTAYPDFQVTIEEQIAEGNKVMTRLLCTGTQMGEDEGIPATRKRVSYTGIAIDQIRDGKVVEMWYVADVWDRLQQLR